MQRNCLSLFARHEPEPKGAAIATRGVGGHAREKKRTGAADHCACMETLSSNSGAALRLSRFRLGRPPIRIGCCRLAAGCLSTRPTANSSSHGQVRGESLLVRRPYHLRHQHHKSRPRERHREHQDERRARDPSDPRKTATPKRKLSHACPHTNPQCANIAYLHLCIPAVGFIIPTNTSSCKTSVVNSTPICPSSCT